MSSERARAQLALIAALVGVPLALAAQTAEPSGSTAVSEAATTPASSAAPAVSSAAPAASSGAPAASSEAPAEGSQTGELLELTEEMVAFERETDEFRRDIAELVERRFEQKKEELQGKYDEAVSQLSVEERKRRDEAIARLEEFLAKYPDNDQYTPDALFRLAEMQFERAYDQYLSALEQYEVDAKRFDDGELADSPAEPRQDYRETISLFDRLLSRWPGNQNADGAMYLKGYCLKEMGEDQPAVELFTTLVQRYPESKFVPEAWLRIGEYNFDYGQLPAAIEAYSKVLAFKDTPFYDKALYKLAWTYYRNDQYDDAIKRFGELVEYSDAQAAKTGTQGSDLRAEAIQYLAISLQEEDWDGNGEADPNAGFQRALQYLSGDKPYEREVLQEIAQIYFDNTKYNESIEATRFLLKRYPTHRDNPTLHQTIITAFERLREFDASFGERDVLAKAYDYETPWHEANRNDLEAVQAAQKLIEGALITAAQYHHMRAQQFKDEAGKGKAGAEDEAIREYKLAAVSYDNYLRKYPESENAYDLSFFYAECLFYSFRFPEAADQYERVRDSALGNQYQEVAAFSAILAREQFVKAEIEAGRIAPKSALLDKPIEETAAQDNGGKPAGDGTEEIKTIIAEPLPEEVARLVLARESYVNKGFNDPSDAGRLPRIAYKAGEVYYAYQDYPKAREWFTWLIERFPNEKVTVFAARNIIQSYRVANDFENMDVWAQKIASAKIGSSEEQAAVAAEAKTYQLGAKFKKAEQLFAAGSFDAAAAKFIELVDADPQHKFADKALNNAAVAFEKTRRFESATNTYERLYRDHPQSELAQTALYRVGVNSERFFDFDRAVTSLLSLVDKYPQFPERADALYRAASIQEDTQQYRAAAANFERYAELFPSRPDTAETFYRTARNFQKLKDTKNELRVYDAFAKRYGNDPKNATKVIEGLARTADVFVEQGNERAAKAAFERVVKEFDARGLQPNTPVAVHPAKARFKLVEYDFAKYEALKLQGSLVNQGKTIQEMQKQLAALKSKYGEVTAYKSVEWTLASFYRIGHLYQVFAQALYAAPVPPGMSEEEEESYRTQLEDVAVPIEDEAVKNFQFAYEKAREFRVTNEWTKKILQALNKYKPSDYPLFKEERRARTSEDLSPARLLEPPPPPPPSAPPGPDDAEDSAVEEAQQ